MGPIKKEMGDSEDFIDIFKLMLERKKKNKQINS